MDTNSIIVLTSLISILVGIGLGYWSQQSQIKWLTTRYRKTSNDYMDSLSKAYPLISQPEPTKLSAFVQNHKK
jgi:ABC-type proline/glycine betaine transport system permease subunit